MAPLHQSAVTVTCLPFQIRIDRRQLGFCDARREPNDHECKGEIDRKNGEVLKARGGEAWPDTSGKTETRSTVDVPRRSQT